MGTTLFLSCIIICVQHFSPLLGTSLYPECGHNAFKKVPSNDDFTTTTHLITTQPSDNAASCTTECFRNTACVAAILDGDNCHLHSDVLSLDAGNADSSPSAVYYEYIGVNECTEGSHSCTPPAYACEDTPRSYRCVCGEGYTGVGTTCTVISMTTVPCCSNADCTKANSRCRSNSFCECDVGYSYNSPDDTCVQDYDQTNLRCGTHGSMCGTYGDDFTRQISGTCMSSGGKYRGEKSLTACEADCTGDTTGTCKVVQYNTDENECYTFHFTHVDQTANWGSSEDCAYHQRNCAA